VLKYCSIISCLLGVHFANRLLDYVNVNTGYCGRNKIG
jgi:hypothetical protein